MIPWWLILWAALGVLSFVGMLAWCLYLWVSLFRKDLQ